MSTQSYEIQDGVRRAKAAEMVGNKAINAEIVDRSGKTIGIQEVAIDALCSPHKAAIDVSTPQKMARFMDTLKKTKAGSKPPRIIVTPGSKGPNIRDVSLEPLEPHGRT